ncbi:MAG: TPM domain-containing protein [Synergistaceae bacterium]|nr:TPM domain-containing protein [Synergistaceae bacterium]
MSSIEENARKISSAAIALTAVVVFAGFITLAAALPASAAGVTAGMRYVYDYAGIFSDSEKARLQALAREYSARTDVHFVILTTDDSSASVLETYSRNFYEQNIAGAGGIAECAMMSVNMRTRRAANDFYGELRTMVSDSEASVIREGYTRDMSNKNYAAAARYFLDKTAKLVGEKIALFNIDVPDAEPDAFVYDFSGRLSGEELLTLSAKAREVSGSMGVGHIVVVLEEAADQEYLRRFASSFYKRNFRDSGLFKGFFILAVSAKSGAVSVSPFGTYQPGSYNIWSRERSVRDTINTVSLYEGCLYFPVKQAEAWQAAHFEMPPMDPARKIYDFAGVLTEEQEEKLQSAILNAHDRYGVDLLIVLSGLSARDTLYAFESGIYGSFSDYERDRSDGNFVCLLIGAPPKLKIEEQYVAVRDYGKKTERKIGGNQRWDIQKNIDRALGKGDYYAACGVFIDDVSKFLGSPIPNIKMADELEWALLCSLLAAAALPVIVLLVLRLTHNAGMRKKISARNYLVGGSLRLSYISDVFLHTHTSRSKKERKSNSGSGSSRGGTSSRSEGRF